MFEEKRKDPKARSRNIDATEQDKGITSDELIKAVREIKNGKSPEDDKITSEMIKSVGDSGNLLLKMFNKAWKEEQVPEDW